MSDWIKHDGEGCPVDSKVSVSVKLRDGRVGSYRADNLRWDHAGIEGDVVKYIVIKELQPYSALSKQVSGEHYKDASIQPIEYIHANELGFFEGNVIKYVTRWRNKNGLDDLEKAKHYIELLIELEGK